MFFFWITAKGWSGPPRPRRLQQFLQGKTCHQLDPWAKGSRGFAMRIKLLPVSSSTWPVRTALIESASWQRTGNEPVECCSMAAHETLAIRGFNNESENPMWITTTRASLRIYQWCKVRNPALSRTVLAAGKRRDARDRETRRGSGPFLSLRGSSDRCVSSPAKGSFERQGVCDENPGQAINPGSIRSPRSDGKRALEEGQNPERRQDFARRTEAVSYGVKRPLGFRASTLSVPPRGPDFPHPDGLARHEISPPGRKQRGNRTSGTTTISRRTHRGPRNGCNRRTVS